jgi:hypothetical protein
MSDGDDITLTHEGTNIEIFVNGTSAGTTATATEASNGAAVTVTTADGGSDAFEFWPLFPDILNPNA